MKQLLCLVLGTFMLTAAYAYPITPRPLRKLVIESDLIIWGKVIKTGDIKRSDENHFRESDYALIAITEMLQGKLTKDTIRVLFSSGMICPAPGEFYEGEQVLTFLDRKKDSKDYLVHALSYGVKHLSSREQYLIYKDRIKEMQTILQKQDDKLCNEMVVEWLIKCAENEVTRWEGMYELSPHSDFMSVYDKEEYSPRGIVINT
jgi:hypothetical protein